MSRVPELLVERVHLGEATSEQRARVMADPDARARLDALSEANAAFLAAHPPESMVAELERKVHVARVRDDVEARQRRWRTLSVVMMPAVAAVLAVVVLQGDPGPNPDTGTRVDKDGTVGTAKGYEVPKLLVYRKVRGTTKRMQDGTVLLRGDQLQLRYLNGSPEPVHGVLVSIDGRGAVTLHAPDEGGSTLLGRGTQSLPHAYELDDAPLFERFFLVSSSEPISVDRVVRAAENVAGGSDARDAELPLGADLEQQDVLIRKAGAR